VNFRITKNFKAVLVQSPHAKKRACRIANEKEDYLALKELLKSLLDIPLLPLRMQNNPKSYQTSIV